MLDCTEESADDPLEFYKQYFIAKYKLLHVPGTTQLTPGSNRDDWRLFYNARFEIQSEIVMAEMCFALATDASLRADAKLSLEYLKLLQTWIDPFIPDNFDHRSDKQIAADQVLYAKNRARMVTLEERMKKSSF
jgi:hypothetical protein